VPYVEKYARSDSRVRVVVNDVEPGPAQAIRYGFERAEGEVVVVTMADGCDDPQLPPLGTPEVDNRWEARFSIHSSHGPPDSPCGLSPG
jgi:hypothetical protein